MAEEQPSWSPFTGTGWSWGVGVGVLLHLVVLVGGAEVPFGPGGVDLSYILGLVLLGFHVAMVASAIDRGDGAWAAGIFLFPLLGDVAYWIYVLSGEGGDARSRSMARGELNETESKFRPGMKVKSRVELRSEAGVVVPPMHVWTVKRAHPLKAEVRDASGLTLLVDYDDLAPLA